VSKSSLHVFKEGGACSTQVQVNIQVPEDVTAKSAFRGKASVVTLGCAKNQVDSEVMLGVLQNYGYEIVSDVSNADVAVVNTCGFLESSVKESIDAILSVSEYKKQGRLRRLIVAGCAVERYRDEMKQTLPEVDEFILTSDLLRVGEAVTAELHENLQAAGRPYFLYDETMPRHLSTKRHTAYVKISEGCNRPCTFCIIPKIRGELRSRSIESIRNEVKTLGQAGVREVNLVAQDLTHFGFDRKEDGRLIDLLKALDADKAVDWIRLLYAYPVGTDEALIQAISELPSLVKYIDIPLQHSSERILKLMKRPIGKYSPRAIVEMIKATAPHIQIRTTFIVGFPGETKEDIDDLVAFVREGYFSNVGVFTYSPEKEAESFHFEGHVTKKEKELRRKRVMAAQQEVAFAANAAYVGQTIPVLLEGPHEETELLFSGRASFQAPEVDGTVIINDSDVDLEQLVGEIVPVEITEVSGYDLVGRVVRQ
jgi:ribosomal protein S12 methylthiotransferase